MSGESLYFSRFKVDGYRGRNFELNLNQPGEPSVFIMDSNTARLLQFSSNLNNKWCF